jgi:NDP-sugar pyrophosphorylase family protein
MKALILAAGLGTRLKPYTDITPKCLFPIGGRPNLDLIIQNLIKAGCNGIMINTHHLHEVVEDFIAKQHYPVPVQTRFEPSLLGTGGAVRNMADFLDDQPFFILNSDVVTDVNLAEMYGFHSSHPYPVTLCLVNDPQFNSVFIDMDDFVRGFARFANEQEFPEMDCLTLSGIHAVDPEVLDHIEGAGFSDILHAYENMRKQGRNIKAYRPDPVYWRDIGTPASYQQAVYEKMAPEAFAKVFPDSFSNKIEKERIKGDGSDRTWHRLKTLDHTLILANHGIRGKGFPDEADAFIAIGKHLHERNIPVPEIISHDAFSGLVFVEDLGDTDLESLARNAEDTETVSNLYQDVIRKMPDLCLKGREGFNTDWTWQTPFYDVPMILEKECRYFVDAFLKDYLLLNVDFKALEEEFTRLAQTACQSELTGFMHRDFQSRNIMMRNSRPYFIDFQGGRIGPAQYDLASLLIDPYVALPPDLVKDLADFAFEAFSRAVPLDKNAFFSCLEACFLTRNLQILGAYSFLTRKKKKRYFEPYIPVSLASLLRNLGQARTLELPGLLSLVKTIRL